MKLLVTGLQVDLQNPQGALTDCEYAMQTGVDNVKALFRRGQVKSLYVEA